jgi:hypothetical protein
VIAVPDALADADSVPQTAPLHPVPDSVQVTPLFCESFCTVAVKACVPPVTTLAVVRDRATLIAGGLAVTVIVAAPDLVPSLADVAVSVIAAGEGTLAGAVYVIAVPNALDVADSVPHAAPLQAVPDSAQVTPLFCESFCTVAVNVCGWPTCSDTVVGDTLTEIAGVTSKLGLLVLLAQPPSSSTARTETRHKGVEIRSTNARLKAAISRLASFLEYHLRPRGRGALSDSRPSHEHLAGGPGYADNQQGNLAKI